MTPQQNNIPTNTQTKHPTNQPTNQTNTISHAMLRKYIGSAKYRFFENGLKKTTEYFRKFLFLFESTILPVNNGKEFHSNGYLGWPCSRLYDRSNF